MQVSKRNIGVNVRDEHEVEVRVWAPLAQRVQLETSTLSLPLEQEEHGYWSLLTSQLKAGDRYWLLLNDGQRLPDPASLAQPDGVHGASEVISLDFSWSDGHWQNHALNDYITYELHTGTFSPEGDFSGIMARLDHLSSLGITAIELMPVGSFPGNRNWGYDGVFPYAVQQSYGGPEALQALVDACHAKGLAVILDVVYNHLGPEGNYLGQFGPYFTEKYHTPWGNAVNFDDQLCDGVRAYVIENALMWFRDFHIDALRLDAVHAIKDFSALHVLQELRQHTDELMKETGRVHYLIAELDLNDPRYISPLKHHGLGMDAQWVDEFHHALRVTAGEPRLGYYSDFSGIKDLAKSYRDAYVYTGAYSRERKRTFGVEASGHSGQQFMVFSQNHDQVGNRMLGERSGTLYRFEMQKLLAAAVFTAPFLPMLFMGEEWGETNPFQYFVSHTDSELVDLVRKGRQEEFAAMHQDAKAPDPQSEETFNRSKLNWSLRSQPPHDTLFRFYQRLINLRKEIPALSGNDRMATRTAVTEAQHCLLLERGITGEQELVLCLMNFSAEEQTITLPPFISRLKILLDSASPEWLGPAAAATSPDQGTELAIQPTSFIAYTAYYD